MKKKQRKPRFVGSGIFMHQQTFGKPLVKGDTCWDADWCPCTKEWFANRFCTKFQWDTINAIFGRVPGVLYI